MKRAILIVLALLILGHFGCETTGPNAGDFNIFSREEEIAMGESLDVQIKREVTILDNPEFTSYVDSVGQAVVNGHDTIEFHFQVIDDDSTINALAAPGGWIYIYTGLIKRMDSEAELAGVLGHEAGHVVARHSTEQLTKLYGYSLVIAAILGNDPGFWESLTAQIFGTAGFMHYSRENEFEADSLGTYYEYCANYDPDGMLGVLNMLNDLSDAELSTLGAVFATHPPTPDRISRVEDQIEGLDPLAAPDTNKTRFHKKVELIGGIYE